MTGQQALGHALLECARLSQGGYVLVRTGQRAPRRDEREHGIDHGLEYRVNVRLPGGDSEVTTSSGQTLLMALQRAVVRLEAEYKRLGRRRAD